MTEFDFDPEFWSSGPRFIAFEGPDGAGKSTLVRGLVTWMREGCELEVEQLLEPGTGDLAKELRTLLLMGDMETSAYEEALMMTTARVDTRLRHVQPALAEGKWVICDRGELSSVIYQGYARDEGAMKFVKELQDMIQVVIRRADLYVVLDVSDEEALRRLRNTGKAPDRFEGAGERFRKRVLRGFEQIDQLVAGEYRMAHVDAECTPQELLQRTIIAIQENCP